MPVEQILEEMVEKQEDFKDLLYGIKAVLETGRITNKQQDELLRSIEELKSDKAINVLLEVELSKLKKEIQNIKLELPEILKTEVVNQVRVPDPVTEVNVKRPDWITDLSSDKAFDRFSKQVKVNPLPVTVSNKEPGQAIAVRLTDAQGKRFYDAIMSVVHAATSGIVGVKNRAGSQINPATSEGQSSMITSLAALNSALVGPGGPSIDSYSHAAISANANTADQSLIAAPGANKQIWVYGIHYTLGTDDGTVSFQDEDDTAISGVMSHALYSGMSVPPSGNFSMPLWKLPTNKALEVDTVTCDIKGWIEYAVVSV